jgi:hypothetical protein
MAATANGISISGGEPFGSAVRDFIERRGRVVNTRTLYLGGLGFDYRPRRPAILIEFLWFFSVPPGECRDSTLKLSYDRFVPNLSISSSFTCHTIMDAM